MKVPASQSPSYLFPVRSEAVKALIRELSVEVVVRLFLWSVVTGVLYSGRVAAVVGRVRTTGTVGTLGDGAGPLAAGLTDSLAGPHHAVASVTGVDGLVLEVSA